MLRFFDRNSADQNRLTFCVSLADFFYDGVPFVFFVEVNFVLLVNTGNRKVCWNYNTVELVDLLELNSLCCGRTSHSRKLCVHSEEVLESDSSHCAVSLSDFYVLFGFDCLMQTV